MNKQDLQKALAAKGAELSREREEHERLVGMLVQAAGGVIRISLRTMLAKERIPIEQVEDPINRTIVFRQIDRQYP